MNHSKRVRSAFAGVSMVAALASPTFGINITFNAADSRIIYFHDAETGDPVNTEGTTVRNLTVTGNNIPSGSAPGYQLNTGTVLQNGGAGTGSSTGRIGIGHVEDLRTATMTIQSLTFVNQNEVITPTTSLKMDGNSIISADFKLVWTATGNYGPPLVGRISIPIAAQIPTGSTSTASVTLENVKWEVDQIIDGIGTNVFQARDSFTGGVSFSSSSPSAATLSSSSLVLKNQVGQTLQLKAGDQFILSGKLTFAADGNSSPDIMFNFGNTSDYEDGVLANDPLRFYRLNEKNDFQIPFLDDNYVGPPLAARYALDSSGHDQHGEYVGDVTPEANTAQFSMGTGAYFPPDPIITFDTNSAASVSNVNVDPDVILAPNSSDIQFGDGQEFTLEAWVSRSAFIGFGDNFLASIIDAQDANGNGFRLAINNDTLLLSGGVGGIDAFAFLGEEGSFFQTNEFYHIVAVYNGDGSVEFFVNGESVGTYDYSLITDSLDSFMRIGNDFAGFAKFPGVIDEVAIYGTALTSVEIVDHFQRGVEDSSLIPLIGIEINEAFAIVPEPATAMLGVIGLTAMAMRRRRVQA